MKQKKDLLLIVLVCLSTLVVKSQTTIEYGPRVGASFTSFSSDNTSLTGNLGLIVGGMGAYNINAATQFIVNADYHQIRGGTRSTGFSGATFTTTNNNFTLHTAELSGLVAYRFPIPFLGSATPRVLGGGSAAYNFYTTNKRSTSLGNGQVSASNSEVVTSSFSPWLYSVQGGLQFEFLLNDAAFSAVMIDFVYRRNLNPLLNGFSSLGAGSASDIYSNSLLMTFGLKLNK